MEKITYPGHAIISFFIIIVNRWDPSQGSNGGWTDGAHSYESFNGFLFDNLQCRGKRTISLQPGKYRIGCMVKHTRPEIKPSPYSAWKPLEVAWKTSEEMIDKVTRPHFRIKALRKGDTWYVGKNQSLSWHSFSVHGKVKVFLVKGKAVATLTSTNRHELTPPGGVKNTGYWRRNLPNNIPPDENYRVLVQLVDDPKVNAFSEYFKIRPDMYADAGKGALKKQLNERPTGVSHQLPAKPSVKSPAKIPAKLKLLKRTNPRGMETWYIGQTYPIKWQSTGIDGRIRIFLVGKKGNERNLTSTLGVDVKNRAFNWKIDSKIPPGSMYKVYIKTLDGKIKSKKSGGFNIKMELYPDAGKIKGKPKIKAPPKNGTIKLNN